MAMALKLGKRDKNALALMFFALAIFAACTAYPPISGAASITAATRQPACSI